MLSAPKRGPGVRDLALALPPGRMPQWLAKRPRKRWRYVGIYTDELMACVGDARIGPVPQRWWAIATPDGALAERTTFGRGGVELAGSTVRVRARETSIELALDESAGVEVVSPVGEDGAYAWTRKQACVPVRGTIEVAGRSYPIDDAAAFIDDSAGYHARHTEWCWSAGLGKARDGRAIGWNLVEGLHDDPFVSERTVWVDGEPQAVGPVTFAEDLSEIASAPEAVTASGGVDLRFSEWSTREHSANALIMRSSYRQPFGRFSGSLPGGIELAHGYGVMEHHDVRW